MGEFLGSSQTAAYMTGPRLGGSGTPTFLPSITIAEPACKPYDTYPAPTPLRRSLTTLPWRPSAYYGSSRLQPNVPNVGSMPEPRSDRNKLTELDSLKVCSHHRFNRARSACPAVSIGYSVVYWPAWEMHCNIFKVSIRVRVS